MDKHTQSGLRRRVHTPTHKLTIIAFLRALPESSCSWSPSLSRSWASLFCPSVCICVCLCTRVCWDTWTMSLCVRRPEAASWTALCSLSCFSFEPQVVPCISPACPGNLRLCGRELGIAGGHYAYQASVWGPELWSLCTGALSTEPAHQADNEIIKNPTWHIVQSFIFFIHYACYIVIILEQVERYKKIL